MNRTWITLAVAAFAAWQAAAEPAAFSLDEYLTPEHLSRIERGEIILIKSTGTDASGNSVGDGLVLGMVNRPRAEVWRQLMRYDDMPQYMPRLQTVARYYEAAGEFGLEMSIKVFWKTVRYSILQTFDETAGTLTWKLDQSRENGIADTVGLWQIREHQPDKTVVAYKIYVDTGMLVPRWIERWLTNRDLPGIVEALKRRVESDGTWTKDE